MPPQHSVSRTWVDNLTRMAASKDTYHMSPVRSIHARVQADIPVWDPTYKLFTSQYGTTFREKFQHAMDSVNTASVEGALLGVQINHNARSTTDMCVRKNNAKFVVFYDVVVAQTNETLALYEHEYGPYVPMKNNGQCVLPSTTCDSINGDNGEPQLGPFVGRELVASDARAPYPNAYRFSFPNSAVTRPYANKTDAARAATRRGLCRYDMMPDGVTCTYNYRIAGFVPLDDVVGITSMRNKANTSTYANFREFCADGGVEFTASTKDGKWADGIAFWREPQDATANAKRAAQVVSAYAAMLASSKSKQVERTLIANTMTALPSVKRLTRTNPPCYRNVKACSTAIYGCKRSLYSQVCTVCTASDTNCATKPAEFTYPTLTKAVGARGTTGELNVDAVGTESSHSNMDALLWFGVALFVGLIMALVALAVHRQRRRRVREPNLKAMLLSQSTRNGSPVCIELAMHQTPPPKVADAPAAESTTGSAATTVTLENVDLQSVD